MVITDIGDGVSVSYMTCFKILTFYLLCKRFPNKCCLNQQIYKCKVLRILGTKTKYIGSRVEMGDKTSGAYSVGMLVL